MKDNGIDLLRIFDTYS